MAKKFFPKNVLELLVLKKFNKVVSKNLISKKWKNLASGLDHHEYISYFFDIPNLYFYITFEKIWKVVDINYVSTSILSIIFFWIVFITLVKTITNSYRNYLSYSLGTILKIKK